MTTSAIIIPFRDRGRDPLRKANLEAVLRYWETYDWPVFVVDDGRYRNRQFNRSAAYNNGAEACEADVMVYIEADMIVPSNQIQDGIKAAQAQPGLVVGFTEYRYLSKESSAKVLQGVHPALLTPERIMPNGVSIGAVNIVSRKTLDLVGGYDENFEGSWYDDNAMKRAFDICAGRTRWIPGPAWHLYHLPGWQGSHLTDDDRAATRRNKARYARYADARTPEQIRALTMENRCMTSPW